RKIVPFWHESDTNEKISTISTAQTFPASSICFQQAAFVSTAGLLILQIFQVENIIHLNGRRDAA
ncbi:MAG: hypothetical protein AAGB11_13995, partial [Pseudomonadota bacterium]